MGLVYLLVYVCCWLLTAVGIHSGIIAYRMILWLLRFSCVCVVLNQWLEWVYELPEYKWRHLWRHAPVLINVSVQRLSLQRFHRFLLLLLHACWRWWVLHDAPNVWVPWKFLNVHKKFETRSLGHSWDNSDWILVRVVNPNLWEEFLGAADGTIRKSTGDFL